MFAGGTGDPANVAVQVAKVKQRFGLSRIAFVGDRGMVTAARIRDDLLPAAGLDWISALRTPHIRQLTRAPGPEKPNGTHRKAPLRPEELVADGVAEVSSPDFLGERLIVCFNPRLKAERARKREDLLQATERVLEDIAKAVRSPRALAWTRRDQPPGRPGHQPPQGGQALRHQNLGWPHRLDAQRGADRRRSTPRRRLRDPHQPSRPAPSPRRRRWRPINRCPRWNARSEG